MGGCSFYARAIRLRGTDRAWCFCRGRRAKRSSSVRERLHATALATTEISAAEARRTRPASISDAAHVMYSTCTRRLSPSPPSFLARLRAFVVLQARKQGKRKKTKNGVAIPALRNWVSSEAVDIHHHIQLLSGVCNALRPGALSSA